MQTIDASRALGNLRANASSSWNRSKDSSTLSDHSDDASNRIYNDYADIRPFYRGPKFKSDVAVFTMGSCFAREIEYALLARGGNVVSIDDSIKRDEFRDKNGHVRNGFFHRFTPAAMQLEFSWPFGRQDGWSDDSLLFKGEGDTLTDLNYMATCVMRTREAVMTRRKVAADLVRQVRSARIIILTLGLTEAWLHKQTSLPVNSMDWRVLKQNKNEFEIQLLDYESVLTSLDTILEILNKEHADGDFSLFLTVSPVPLAATFTDQDVVVANATSKSTLRAAAIQFAMRNDKAHYFPSFELVTYSNPEMAWRPDRVHVQQGMVGHIMNSFMEAVFET